MRDFIGCVEQEAHIGGRGNDEMRAWVSALIGEYTLYSGNVAPPINAEILAKLRNAKITPRRGSENWIASLMPMGRGFVIHVQEALARTRRRNAICHEIGHIFFFDTESNPPRRRIKPQPDALEERLCFWAAREMLVPETWCKTMLTEFGRESAYSFDGIKNLASIFEVSPDIIAYRLTHDLALLDNDWIILWYLSATKDVQTRGEALRYDFRPRPLYPKHVSVRIRDWMKLEIDKVVRDTVLECLQKKQVVTAEHQVGRRKRLRLAVRTEPVSDRPRLCAISWVSPISS